MACMVRVLLCRGGEGDAGTGELHDGVGKQGAPFADFAVLLGTGGRDHRHGAAEGDDHAAFPARPAACDSSGVVSFPIDATVN